MTSQGKNKLHEAIDGFTNMLNLDEKKTLFTSAATPGVGDIISPTSDIDKIHSKKVRKLSSRFRPFLNSVQQFSAVVDTFTQAKPEISALVWGSVKLFLMISMNFFDYFEKLSQMFMELGGICPVLQDYQTLFPRDVKLQESLYEFFAVVIDFCKEVVVFLRKNDTRKFLKTIWNPFKVQFEDLEAELNTRRNKIDMLIRLASDKAASNERQEACLYRKQGLKHRLFEMRQWEESGEWRPQQDEKQRKLTRGVALSAGLGL